MAAVGMKMLPVSVFWIHVVSKALESAPGWWYIGRMENISSLPIRDFLKTELARRCQKNPNYSMRAFASHLELSPAFLSKLLRGERTFTAKTVGLIAEKLSLSPQQTEYYRRKTSKRSIAVKDLAFEQMSMDHFQLLADWYHFAILELVTLESFQPSAAWIADQLGLNVHIAEDAIQRLNRLGYIRMDGARWELVEKNRTTIGPEVAVPAGRRQQTQILEQAIAAMAEIPIENRSQTSVTLAISAERIGEAKELIAEFRRRFSSIMQSAQKPQGTQTSSGRDSVYQLSISFYPLTKNQKQKRPLKGEKS